MTVLLVEIDAWDASASPELQTWRVATEAYAASDAPGFFSERIVETPEIVREIRGDGGGAGRLAISDLVLANADGGLDALISQGTEGREVRAWTVASKRAAWSTRTALFTQTNAGVTVTDFRTLAVPILDGLSALDVPYHSESYAGDNTLPAGFEGTGDDVEGLPKPEPVGSVLNMAPPVVNTSRLIYQFAAGSLDADTTAVWEGGIALMQGSDYPDEATVQSTAPSAGQYRVLPRAGSGGTGGYFRLGSAPQHTITCDVATGADAAARTVAQVLKALAARAGVTLSAADVSALDTADANVCGWHEEGETTILAAMEAIAAGAGVWFGFDASGVLRAGQWAAPTGTPAATFRVAEPGSPLAAGEFDLISIEGLSERPAVVSKVTALFGRNYTVQSDLQTAVTAARRAIVEAPWLREIAEDATVLDAFPLAQSVEIETPYQARAGGTSVAGRVLARDEVQRRPYALRTPFRADLGVELGAVIRVTLPRFDFASGKLLRVRRLSLDPVRGIVEIEGVG